MLTRLLLINSYEKGTFIFPILQLTELKNGGLRNFPMIYHTLGTDRHLWTWAVLFQLSVPNFSLTPFSGRKLQGGQSTPSPPLSLCLNLYQKENCTKTAQIITIKVIVLASLILGDTFQDSQWMPGIAGSTNRYCVFSYCTQISMLKFNL
jgi:hypothetical protein